MIFQSLTEIIEISCSLLVIQLFKSHEIFSKLSKKA
jgi:hypothetical protein